MVYFQTPALEHVLRRAWTYQVYRYVLFLREGALLAAGLEPRRELPRLLRLFELGFFIAILFPWGNLS